MRKTLFDRITIHGAITRLAALRPVALLCAVLLCASIQGASLHGAGIAHAADTPEQIVTRYIDATRALRFAELAAMMHPSALADFKSMMREVVELDSTSEATELLFQVKSLADYDSLPGSVAFERLMHAMIERNPMIADALTQASGTVLGHVNEGDDLVHVVYRVGVAAGAKEMSKIEVVTLKRDGEEWRTLLAGNIEGLAQALKQQVGGE